ncbi:MAG: OsmC family protein [Flavitalea sp.]
MAKVELERANGAFGFEARDINGHKVMIDTSPETGGLNFGVRPMQLLLMGLGGCSGIDILSILKKQRQEVTDFKMYIEGVRQDVKDPSLWKEVTIVFQLVGTIDPDKAQKACSLSMEKYCSVADTLKKSGTNITWKVIVNP